ncbi:hypothetical protein [Acetobacter pasteurianus]|uniref:hypothetical protein n=1 Tax=Acetobacter pasteurianus TaxID=438 RepID=UPI0013646CEC|nr:hypothetical protein [Acetobacter pasteurianus]QHM90325.1 hypothetical protein FCN51_01655 [Acetobacter pasteurianus]
MSLSEIKRAARSASQRSDLTYTQALDLECQKRGYRTFAAFKGSKINNALSHVDERYKTPSSEAYDANEFDEVKYYLNNLLSNRGLIIISGAAGTGRTNFVNLSIQKYLKTNKTVHGIYISRFKEWKNSPCSGKLKHINPSLIQSQELLRLCSLKENSLIICDDLYLDNVLDALRCSLKLGKTVVGIIHAASPKDALYRLSLMLSRSELPNDDISATGPFLGAVQLNRISDPESGRTQISFVTYPRVSGREGLDVTACSHPTPYELKNHP